MESTFTMSRAQRRRAEKLGSRRAVPNKYGIKASNTLQVAQTRAIKLSEEDQAKQMALVRGAQDLMRRGQWRNEEWNLLTDALNVGAALAHPFNICSNHHGTFVKAVEAMSAIITRVHKGIGWTCYGQELTAIDAALEMYGIQLTFCSNGELHKAFEYVKTRLADALVRGKRGDIVVHTADANHGA